MEFFDCKYYYISDFWKGGFLAECKKKKVQISDEEDVCKDCEHKEKEELKEGMFECLDLENGVAYDSCNDCVRECRNRYYFEKTVE